MSGTPPDGPPRAITIAVLAMGGEGGGVLADWIVDLAEHSGYCAQTTSVPGVAQRTGSTIYYIEIFSEAAVRTAGRPPVLALMPVPGEVDIVIASELMEAARAVQRGLVTPDRTTLIASTHRVFSMNERTALGDGHVDAGTLIEACRVSARKFVSDDFGQLAESRRSVVSAVLFGALAGTEALPFSLPDYEAAIRRGGVGVDASLAAFGAGVESAKHSDRPSSAASDAAEPVQAGPRLRPLEDRIRQTFPEPARHTLIHGIIRLADFQDIAWADEYVNRLHAVRDADERHGDRGFRLLTETARHLALWMSYEDAVRVADLKIRRARFDRVRRGARPAGEELVQIREFLHPGVEEISDVLPASLGRWLRGSPGLRRVVERLTRHGMTVETTSLRGFLQLYALAALRPLRRRSLRFAEENRRIGQWLDHVVRTAPADYRLAIEIAELPRVVKGYGDTHHRGRKHFDTMLTVLPRFTAIADGDARLRRLRDAALADDTGASFAQVLKEVGT